MHKILIIDDEEGALDIIEACIKQSSTTIYKALDGKEGWEAYKSVNPDLVITDYSMPGYNGLELAMMIKKENPHCPIILVSGYQGLDEETKSQFTMTFKKPFNIKNFQEFVATLIEK
ncbi:MAG: response regulator transcription factor [Oligoflexales bacterium]